MPPSASRPHRQRLALLAALITFVGSLYMLSYSARIESGDSLFMLNATQSLVRFGDLNIDITSGERRFWDYEPPLPDGLPLLPVAAEPLQMVLAAPLYALSTIIPGIGHIHTLYLFNVLVTLAIVAVFYAYALQLGYDVHVALLGAGLLGLGTILAAYSKTFFQEPLTALAYLLLAYCLERWRASGWRSVPMLLAALLTLGLAWFVRRGVLITLPTMLVIAAPAVEHLFTQRGVRRAFWGAVIALTLAIYGLTVPVDVATWVRFSLPLFGMTLAERIALNQGVQMYLFSVGGSIWATSPVLLLAIPGMWLLSRRGDMRYPVAALTLLLSYALAYAYLARFHWNGGLSWPPRFLVPTVPLLMLLTLPVLHNLLASRRRWLWGAVGTVTAYSLWVQFNAVSYWWGDYSRLMTETVGDFSEWTAGLHNLRYVRWVMLPRLWGTLPLDFAWVRTGQAGGAALFVGLALVALTVLIGLLRQERPPLQRAAWMLPALWIAAAALSLHLMHDDPLYLNFSEGLHRANAHLLTEIPPDEAALLAEPGYEDYFLNYGHANNPRLLTLPFHLGEQYGPDEMPQITGTHPLNLMENPSEKLIQALARRQDTLTVIYQLTPFLPWANRVVEQYMVTHYYPLRALNFTGDDGLPVYLGEYAVSAQHDPFTLTGPATASDLRYGDAITLAGFTLPLGDEYAPGDVLPLSLYWLALAPVDADYTIALYLAADGGGVVASGSDSPPVGGFAPTTSWRVNAPVWDNRALRIPTDLPAGGYRLWVALYRVQPDGTIANAPVTGAETVENGIIGVLPVTLLIK